MYKSRLIWGNTLFLAGAVPAILLLKAVAPDEAAAQAGAVGFLILSVLAPLMAIGALFSTSAVVQLTSLAKIKTAAMNNSIGALLIAFGWFICCVAVTLMGFIVFAVLRSL